MSGPEIATPERTADLIHSAAIHLLRHVAREDPRSGITAARLSALSVIVFAGPLGLTELAEAQQVRPPTMTRIVNALEQAGLVAKRREGRTVSLSATPAGHALLQRARERRLAVLTARLHALSPAEVATIAEAADLLERAIRASAPPRG
jgi:DNA-binding MarR family transcriptional regulator